MRERERERERERMYVIVCVVLDCMLVFMSSMKLFIQ